MGRINSFSLSYPAVYEDRCRTEGRPSLIAPDGIYQIGEFFYANDGVLYVNGESHGPYMVAKRYYESTIVVRFAEVKNTHRFEALRWKLLHRIQKLNARRTKLYREIKRIAKGRNGGCVVGPYKDGWRCLSFSNDYYGGFSTESYKVTQDNVLDTMSTAGAEHHLVAQFLILQDTIEAYWLRVSRMENALLWIFRELNPEGKNHYVYRTSVVRYKVNGRDYVVFVGSQGSRSECRTSWPAPGQTFVDLDEARYEPKEATGG